MQLETCPRSSSRKSEKRLHDSPVNFEHRHESSRFPLFSLLACLLWKFSLKTYCLKLLFVLQDWVSSIPKLSRLSYSGWDKIKQRWHWWSNEKVFRIFFHLRPSCGSKRMQDNWKLSSRAEARCGIKCDRVKGSAKLNLLGSWRQSIWVC